MKILLTGGAGFIGSHIAALYLQAGHQVVIIDDLSTGMQENIPSGAKFYQCSIHSPEVFDIFNEEQAEVLNHHAAQVNVRLSVESPTDDANTNIIGSLNVLEAARKTGVKKVIFASSGGAIYGEQNSYPADESHPTDPISPYGISKLAIEKYLNFYRLTYGMKTVVLRYANVYGPRQANHGEAGVISIFVNKLLNKESPTIFGDGTQTRDFVFVKDVAQANLAALDESQSGFFNIGTGIETSLNQLTEQLISLCHSNVHAQYSEAKPGELQRSCLQPSQLQETPPTPIAMGLDQTITWFQEKRT